MVYKSYSQCSTLLKPPVNGYNPPVLISLHPQRMSTCTFRSVRWSICSLFSAGWIICWCGSCRCAVPFACGTPTRYCCTNTSQNMAEKPLHELLCQMCHLSGDFIQSGLGLRVLIENNAAGSTISFVFEPTTFGLPAQNLNLYSGSVINCA